MFFFFKQKTAYEMLISDWISAVCSSDLIAVDGPEAVEVGRRHVLRRHPHGPGLLDEDDQFQDAGGIDDALLDEGSIIGERRVVVGKQEIAEDELLDLLPSTHVVPLPRSS